MKNKTVIANISCAQCNLAKFLVIQIDNDLHLICVSCGYMTNIQDTLINPLNKVKEELKRIQEGQTTLDLKKGRRINA